MLASLVIFCAACGAATSSDPSAERVAARHFVALIASSDWRYARALETAATAATPAPTERQLHEAIRDLGARTPGRISIRADRVLVVLRGRQRLRRDRRVVAVRSAAVFVTLFFAREHGEWKIASFAFSQSSRIALVRHTKRR